MSLVSEGDPQKLENLVFLKQCRAIWGKFHSNKFKKIPLLRICSVKKNDSVTNPKMETGLETPLEHLQNTIGNIPRGGGGMGSKS